MKTVLGFDVDSTVLNRGESLGEPGRPKKILDKFLTILKQHKGMMICFITGNDYEGLQKARVADPFLVSVSQGGREQLLSRVLIYADGATRKFTFDTDTNDFTEDESYRDGPPRTFFTEDEGDELVRIIGDELSKLIERYRVDPLKLEWPNISYEYVPVNSGDPLGTSDLRIVLFPVNVNPPRGGGRQGLTLACEFCDPTHGKVATMFAEEFRIFPEITLREQQARIDIVARRFSNPGLRQQQAELADIVIKLYELFRDYPLSSPTFQLRGSAPSDLEFLLTQLAMKPIKNDEIRQELIEAVNPKLPSAIAVKGGRTTVDVQRMGIHDGATWIANKTCAIRDIIKRNLDCTIKYFGDEFHEGGNDRCIAEMPEAQEGIISCFNVGKRGVVHECIFDSGGGPSGVLSHLQFAYS